MAARRFSASGREVPYYDILLLGRTGVGKSTTGNKILGFCSDQPSFTIKQHVSKVPGLLRNTKDEPKRFMQADDITDESRRYLSVTNQCEVLSSKKTISVDGVSMKLRIFDTPGFADSGELDGQEVGLYEGNLKIIRSIVRVQAELRLKFRRIVYFLPSRAPLERADRVLQEELKVMYHYFGKSIFDCMVLAGTNAPNPKYQTSEFEFGNQEIEITRGVFEKAMRLATGDQTLRSPPVVYIGLYADSKVVEGIQSAPVLRDSEGFELKIRDDTCSRCSVKIRYAVRVVEGKEFEERIGVIRGDRQKFKPYEDSECHPFFKSKYSKAIKFVGGLGHVLTVGVPYAVGKALDTKVWPGFTNSDEKCGVCKAAPGTEGCVKVKTKISIRDTTNDASREDTDGDTNDAAIDATEHASHALKEIVVDHMSTI